MSKVVVEKNDRVTTVIINRPECRNAVDHETALLLRAAFAAFDKDEGSDVAVLTGAGGAFCAGYDLKTVATAPVHDPAGEGPMGPSRMLLSKPVIAAVEGICAGAGAIIAMAADMRLAAPNAKVGFLFNKVGLAGCDMGACAILPRIIGQSRASELLYTGRFMTAEEGERWGFFSRIVPAAEVLSQAQALARDVTAGPTFANTMTKRMLAMEWAMSVEEAVEAEAVAQALCMTTQDFERAFHAFAAKQKPVFEGN